MSNEIIMHQENISIVENDNFYGVGNGHLGELSLYNDRVVFLASSGILGMLNKKNNKYLSEAARENCICVLLEHIAGVECAVHKVPFRKIKIAIISLHLYDGEVFYFYLGGTEISAQWIDAIRSQCSINGLKRPYLKVNGELVN